MEDDELEALLGALAEAPSLPLEPLGVGSALGPYRLEASLGRGGMGRVFEAVDTRLQRRVAIKVLERTGAAARQAILREARAAAAVEHPALVRVYDVGEIDGQGYVAMERVEGRPLTERRLDHDPVVLATTIAGALAALHAGTVAHRDLKPSNLVVDAAGRVKLVDFGLAARTSEDAPPGGTPGFAPPELGLGVDPGIGGDVHAFGVLLRWLGSGTVAGPAPPALRALAAECTRASPAQRPADGAALVGALDRLTRRRRRRRATAAALGLVAAGVIASVAVRLLSPAPPPPPPREPAAAANEPAPGWVRLTDLASSAMLFEGVHSADGSQLAYAERRGVFVRDLGSERVMAVAPPSLGAHCVAFAPDGGSLWIGGADGVYRATLGELGGERAPPVRVLTGPACPMPSPDGQWLALERADRLELVRLEGGEPRGDPRGILEGPLALVVSAFATDSRRLAALAVRQTRSGSATVDLLVIDLDGESRRLTSDPAFWMPTRGLALVWLDPDSLLVGHGLGGPDGAAPPQRRLLRTSAERWDPAVYTTLPFDPCRLSLDSRGRVAATSHSQQNVLLVGSLGAGGLENLIDVSRSLAALRPSDWSQQPLWVVEQRTSRFRALALPLGDDGLPQALLPDPATWPLRTAGGMVSWRPARSRDERAALVFRDAAGREHRVAEAAEPAPGAAGWGRPPPVSHWAACDPNRPRCSIVASGDEARLWSVALPAGTRSDERPLPSSAMARLAVRWTEEPEVAIPLRGESALLVVRGDRMERLALPEGCKGHGVADAGDGAWIVTAACQPPEPYRVLRLAPGAGSSTLHRDAERWLGDPVLDPTGERIALAANVFRSNVWRLTAPGVAPAGTKR